MLRNVYLRCLLFLLLTVTAFSVQFLSLSKLIDQRVDANQDALKNYINYFSTACNTAFAVLMFFLGFLFTRDVAWHLGERPGSRRFNMAWSLSPNLSAAVTGFRIGGMTWVAVGCALTLLTAFSLVRNVWLTLSIQILPHVSIGPTGNFSISSIYGDPGDNTQLSRQGFLSRFSNEMMMGLKGTTVLHPDNGEYIWSPWLTDSRASSILVENVQAVGLRPKCTLLKPSQVAWHINAANDSIAVNIAASLYNTSEPVDLYLEGNRLRTLWNSTVVRSAQIPDEDHPYYLVSYNVFTTVQSSDPKTNYTFESAAALLKAYVYACRIDVNRYNISGQITSNPGPSLDRLQLTSKVKVKVSPPDESDDADTYNDVYRAFTAFSQTMLQVRPEDLDDEACRPTQCWLIDSIPGIYTGYNSSQEGPVTRMIYEQGWIGMSPTLLEYKLAQAVGYILSPSIFTRPDTVLGSNVTHDFVMQTTPKYIFAGVSLQLVLVLLIVGLYLVTVSDLRAGHSDDLDYLVALIREDDMMREEHIALKGRQD